MQTVTKNERNTKFGKIVEYLNADGLPHRTDGPAIIYYDVLGNVDESFFCLNGNIIG